MKKSKYKDPTNKILTFLLIITIIANARQLYLYKAYERFDWQTSVISSKGNVIQVSNCDFKGNFYHINKNMILNNGWDKKNNSENEIKNTFLPDSLSIKWFSYNEQKFYNGIFSLPYESILQKAKQLDITHSKKGDDRIFVVAEVRQKGKVVVWIQKFDKNNEETKLEIGMFQAKEIKTTWHIFDYYLQKDTTSYINIARKVDLVMEKHPYILEVKLPSGYSLTRNSYFTFFNQNNWEYTKSGQIETVIFNFVPQKFYLTWGNGTKKFTTQFYFEEDKFLETIRKENENGDKSKTLILKLVIDNSNNAIKVILKNTKTNSEFILKDKYKTKNERSIFLDR